jgi:hypothetical protein
MLMLYFNDEKFYRGDSIITEKTTAPEKLFIVKKG